MSIITYIGAVMLSPLLYYILIEVYNIIKKTINVFIKMGKSEKSALIIIWSAFIGLILIMIDLMEVI